MIVRCQSCQATFKVEEARLAGKATARFRCASCKTTFDVPLPAVAPAGAPAHAGDQTAVTRTVEESAPAIDGGIPRALPQGKRVSLAILSGPDQGTIVSISRPRLEIGRTEGDVVLGDEEASRRHAALEFYGGRVLLKDLGSTNGTFVAGRRIETEELAHQAEFQIGKTRMMVILTDIDE